MNYTTEQIARAMAPYLFNAKMDTSINGTLLTPKVLGRVADDECDGKLLLRPVSELTDEEQIQLGDILGVFTPEYFISALKGSVANSYKIGIKRAFKAQQYLQSIGVDLPSFHLGGKTLFEAGIATHSKEVNSGE